MSTTKRQRLKRLARSGNVGAALELANDGDPQPADELLHRLSAAGAHGMLHILGTVYEALGDRDRAIAAYRESMAADPEEGLSETALARMLGD